MSAQGCRIGKVSYKSGAVLRVIPSAKEAASKQAFGALGTALADIGRLYEGRLDGFALVTWTREGNFSAFRHIGQGNVGTNMMPEYVAEALRRENSDDDCKRILDHLFRSK